MEKTTSWLIKYDEWISDSQVKFFSTLFSQFPKKKTTKIWDRNIYDLATQYFVYWEINIPIYWSFEFKELINKIVKDNWWDFLDITEIDDWVIDEFRKYFYRHPKFLEVLFSGIPEGQEFKMFNEFLKYTIEYKILKDEDLNAIREVRKFLYTGWNTQETTGDLYNDLFHFLNFQRFTWDWWLEKEEIDKVLNDIIEDINSWVMENPMEFKTFADWNKFPNKHLEAIEKLVLKTYTYDPLSKTKKEQTCKAIDKINLWVLKSALDFNPRWRQRYALVYESRENLASNTRRSWKTYWVIYLAIRQIMLPQQLVLYILPNKEWFSEQPFYYIEKMFDNLKNLHWVEWNIPGLQFNNKTFKVINKELKSKILFISAVWGTKWGRSFSANLIIMDEAWYTDDADMYDVSYSATTDTRWRMRAISTINKDTPINRFFYKKLDLEWWQDSVVLVVDIYNNEFIPDDEKLKLEAKYKVKNPKIWLSEYMAIFVWQGDTFDISWFFRMDFDYDVIRFWQFNFRLYKKLDKYSMFIINRDPWRDIDPWWLSILGVKNRNEVDLICSEYMRVPNYIIQANAIIDIYEYLKKQKQTYIVIDTWKAGIWMVDYLNSKQIYPFWVASTGWSTINNPSPRIYNISTSILEWNLKVVMNTSILQWFSWLNDIRHEYETFEASKTRQWTNHHHDILSSLMIGITVSLERGFISFKKEVSQQKKNEWELLYEMLYEKQPQNNWGWKFLY